MDHSSSDENPGLIAGLSSIARNIFGLLVSRIELAAVELGEMRNHLVRVLLVCGFGLIVAWFALACWTALIVVVAWESWGWKILMLMALLFSVVAIGIFLYVRTVCSSDKLSMPATMEELRKDRDALL